MLRIFRYIIWAILAALSFAIAVAFLNKHEQRETMISSDPVARVGAPFQLTDHNGLPITERVMAGQPTAIFFGFTHCPEVCPTTLQNLSAWSQQLGEKSDQLKILFVTVDPRRDTPQVLKAYINKFSKNITAITGNPNEVAQLVKAWHVYTKRIPLNSGDYTMDHTASIFLIRRDGTLQGTISYQDDTPTALKKLQLLISS